MVGETQKQKGKSGEETDRKNILGVLGRLTKCVFESATLKIFYTALGTAGRTETEKPHVNNGSYHPANVKKLYEHSRQ